MGSHFGAEVTQIAMMLGGIALVALLVSHADGASKLVETTAKSYGGLLNIVTLQNQNGNAFAF